MITAKAAQGCDAKVSQKVFPWRLWELARRDTRKRCRALCCDGIREGILILGNKAFRGCNAGNFGCDGFFCSASRKLTDQEFAGGDIDNPDAGNRRPQNGRDEEVV